MYISFQGAGEWLPSIAFCRIGLHIATLNLTDTTLEYGAQHNFAHCDSK